MSGTPAVTPSSVAIRRCRHLVAFGSPGPGSGRAATRSPSAVPAHDQALGPAGAIAVRRTTAAPPVAHRLIPRLHRRPQHAPRVMGGGGLEDHPVPVHAPGRGGGSGSRRSAARGAARPTLEGQTRAGGEAGAASASLTRWSSSWSIPPSTSEPPGATSARTRASARCGAGQQVGRTSGKSGRGSPAGSAPGRGDRAAVRPPLTCAAETASGSTSIATTRARRA